MYPLVHGSVSDVVIHDYGTVPANKTPFNFKKDILLTYIYIIVDDTKVQGDIAHSCAPVGDMDCDLNDDGINDVFGGGDRSWLDLDGGGGGAADLKDWVEHGYEGGIAPHTWLAGQSGVADSVYKTVNQTANLANPNGSPATYPVFLVPIFDGICDQNPEGKPVCMTTLHDPVPDEETVIVTGGSSTMYFHINGVSAMYVTCVDEGGKNQCPGAKAFIDANPDYKNLKTIEGYFIDNYPFELGNPGTGGVDVGVHIVSLSQ